MKALSVRQPYAWALSSGHKPVENRVQNFKHRGALAIHSPLQPHRLGLEDPAIHDAWQQEYGEDFLASTGALTFGAVVGVVDLVAVHVPEHGCCAPWGHTGPRVRHLVVDNAVAIAPVPCLGALSMWTLPDDVAERVAAALLT